MPQTPDAPFDLTDSTKQEIPKLATPANPLLLDIGSIARITGGTWCDLPDNTAFTGIAHNLNYLKEGSSGNLYFASNADARDHAFTKETAKSIIRASHLGAAAAVVPHDAIGLPEGLPLLRVDNAMSALEALGIHVRDRLFTGKRVIVTGTEGKTGFKCMLHHVLSPQIPTHAILNSSNLDFSLYASLASIRQHDRIAILEAAGTHPGRCKRRSNIVKPHLFVITEVGNEHIMYHGSQQAVIEGKADIALGMCDGGYGILNADSRNYAAVRKAVLSRRQVPLLLFGSTPECNGRLIGHHFENNGWNVSAEIEGEKVEYRLPLLGEHAPLASVSVLLAAHHLGAGVARAAKEFADFVPYESQGVLRRIMCHGGEALLFDNATRASVLSYQSALRTAARLSPPAPDGKKVALIGQMIYLGDEAEQEHARLAEWIDEAGFNSIILVGKHTETTYAHLKNQSVVVKRLHEYDRRNANQRELQQLIEVLMENTRPGDLLFVKGEVDELGDYLRTLEIKH
jgi:UDP-N-acetylmuramyl pentapeptide synthase